jgi:hypothetical protein
MKAWKVPVALAALWFSVPAPVGASVIADLSGDWSNVNNPNHTNPNGTWAYRQGTIDLPLISPWTADSQGSPGFTACNQPAWAPSNTAGNFLPAEFKANSCAANYFNSLSPSPGDHPGDVIMHTVDPFNGNPALGVGNYLFTSAVNAGRVTISGMVWDASLFYGLLRPQDWALLLNGALIDSGSLSGLISRSEAQTFDLSETLGIGDTVELELYEAPTAAAGFFVGAELTIATTKPIPDPPSFALLGAGLAGLAAVKAGAKRKSS